MLSIRAISVIVFVSCVCTSLSQVAEYSPQYDQDATQLDFVYHDHDEMTSYLR